MNLCGSASKSDVGAIIDNADVNNSELADWALVRVGGAPPQHTDFLKSLTGMNLLSFLLFIPACLHYFVLIFFYFILSVSLCVCAHSMSS